MSAKSERQAAREAVAAYHEARLAELVEHVGRAVDSFRVGELDAFAADRVLYQYSRSAKELWKFCNLAHVEIAAQAILRSTGGHADPSKGSDLDQLGLAGGYAHRNRRSRADSVVEAVAQIGPYGVRRGTAYGR